MKEAIDTPWIEMISTVASALFGSFGIQWYWRKRADKEMDTQRVEDGNLKDQIHDLALEVKTTALNANTDAMNSMAASLRMFAESNNKKDIILENIQKSLDTAHLRIDRAEDKISHVKEHWVSETHCNSKMNRGA
jgi:hypothetical protein